MTSRRVLVVPALPVEAKAILSFFEDVTMKSTPTGTTYMTGRRKVFATELGKKIKEHWVFFIATPTAAGNLEMSRAVQRMLPECNPHLVALIGCAGGFPGRIAQFDVAVATQIDYIARTKISAKTEMRPLQEVCSKVFVDHCKSVQLLDLWHQYLAPEVSNAPINVYFDPIVSGETVLANSRSKYYHLARSASPKAVAIEMEGYGLLSTCREHQVEAVVLRGISDTLDDKNNLNLIAERVDPGPDRAQFKATRHAAALFLATLDFINPNAFLRNAGKIKKDITKVSMILDAEMHNVSDVQSDLFEIFKKYGIKQFSFKSANSIRIEFDAQLHAMRIYEALIRAGVIKKFGGFRVLDFKIKTDKVPDRELSNVLERIAKLDGVSDEELLRVMRAENWINDFPEYAKVVIDALEHHRRQDLRALKHQKGRILYPQSPAQSGQIQLENYFGPTSTPKLVLSNPTELRAKLTEWQPLPTKTKTLQWFMGHNILDREVGVDTLLAHSQRRLFYAWPGLASVYSACGISETVFIDACIREWQMMRQVSGPSILHILDQEKWDRLGRRQVRDAISSRPATLSKAIDILSLTSRVLSQNGLPVQGCIIPSFYVLMFNGTIANDGVVERMLLTGMAGDLNRVANETGLTLRAVQSSIKGDTLPYRAASKLATELDRTILTGSKLSCTMTVLDADDASARHREAVDLGQDGSHRYLQP